MWGEVLECSHPSYQHNIPDPSSMNNYKLVSNSYLTSDTYNGVRKTHSLIVEKVHEAAKYFHKDDSDDIRILEVDCWNHLRNVWLGGIKNALYALLGNILREGLYGIDLRLRFLAII